MTHFRYNDKNYRRMEYRGEERWYLIYRNFEDFDIFGSYIVGGEVLSKTESDKIGKEYRIKIRDEKLIQLGI